MKRILTTISILLLIPLCLVYLRLKPRVIFKQSLTTKNNSYIQIVETPGDWFEALVGLDTPYYRFEYIKPDGYHWSSLSYRGESYKVVNMEVVYATDGLNIIFDSSVVGILSNGVWHQP